MYNFNVAPLFQENYNAREDIIINQGGTDSGKTVAILQVLCTIATTTKPPTDISTGQMDDPVITVLAESIPNLKKGAWRKMQSIMADPNFRKYLKNPDSTGDRVLHFKSGWIMEFISVVDEQNAKQGKRQYLFVNEANGIPWNIFWQMAKRTRVRTYIDYNPSAPFWAGENLIGTTPDGNDLSATVRLIISDHRHNPFLSEREHMRTEGIKNKELWKVYARGLTGNIQGLIYTTWKMISDEDFPWDADGKFGALDFGYTNDPTAGVYMVKIANTIYVHELCYHYSMTATQIKELYKSKGFKSETPIYCEHDPDMIRQLRNKNLMTVPARKGQGSLNAGIMKVNEYEICYTASSSNIDFERKRYMWMTDPESGKLLNEPEPGNDHLMDAIRYGVYSRFFRANR